MGIQHFAVALALTLVHLFQRAIVKHAVLTIATLHLKRGVGHGFTASCVNKRRAVRQCRLGTQRVQALPGLPGKDQQRQQDQQKGHHDELSQGTGKNGPAFQRITLLMGVYAERN